MENLNKDVLYLNKDFNQFQKNLIDFTKTYFPTQYTDFSDSSPGMIFFELAAYVGDVLSYYADNNLKESLLPQATERGNIIDLAYTLGYTPKNVVPAMVTLNVYQLVPAAGTGDSVVPNYDYALTVKEGMQVKQSDGAAEFRTLATVDFSSSSSFDPTTVTIYESDDSTSSPTYYLLEKKVKAVSGKLNTATFTFTTPKPYDKVIINEKNIAEIVSITESDGDNWYNVPYLAQDTIFDSVVNLLENDPDTVQYRSSCPHLLKLRKTAKRFVSRFRSDKTLEIQFGAGVSDNPDEEIIPNPTNVGDGLAGFRKNVDVDIDPSNFLYTRAYGQAPSNTTLTIKYTTSNGVIDNVSAGVLTEITSVEYDDDANSTASTAMMNFVKSSLAANNLKPASGAKTADTLQDIKNNAIANFATQNRNVTKEDYIIRCYSMPERFGSIAKAYIVPDDQLLQTDFLETRIANPLAMNLYVLGFDSSKDLTTTNDAIKNNLKTYLDYYRILTDAINIKDAFIINIGVEFEITVRSNYNSNEVLIECINKLREYFNIDRWQINQPIIKTEILNTIANVTGVQSVIGVKFNNLYKTSLNYSGNVYDLETATRNGIVYPSLDPSIFEVKFPNQDIKGRVVSN